MAVRVEMVVTTTYDSKSKLNQNTQYEIIHSSQLSYPHTLRLNEDEAKEVLLQLQKLGVGNDE